MTNEFYTRPILAIQSVTDSVTYYREALGSTKMWRFTKGRPIIVQLSGNGLEIFPDSSTNIPRL